MTEFWRQYEGQVVDGTFRLEQYLGSNESSAVFLTNYAGEEPRKAAIKLTRADPHNTELQLRLWQQIAKLSHPHLMRLFQTGQCQMSNLPLLYVVMEYADEDLAKVIPHRPLTATEARELLDPALSGLSYIHAKGFVHGRLRPANFMAVDGQLRISSDGLCRIEECMPAKPDAYAPPEIMKSGPTTAGDIWSLGMTLVEALTQRLPAWRAGEPKDPALPESLPAPFSAIARHCLRWNPQSRWTVSDIRKHLAGPSSAPQEQPAAEPQGQSLKWVWVSTTVLGLVLVAMIVVPKLRDRDSDTYRAPVVAEQPANSAPSSEQAAADKAAAKKAAAKKAAAEKAAANKAAADKAAADKAAADKAAAEKAAADRAAATKAAADKAAAERAARAAVPPPPSQPERSAGATADGIVRREVPEALPRARNSIHGKVAVIVKVHADASGNVADAEFDNPGPSKYFADLALAAARRWKFAPSSAWTLRFEFRKTGTTVMPSRAAP